MTKSQGKRLKGANSQQHGALTCDLLGSLTLEWLKSVSFLLIPISLHHHPTAAATALRLSLPFSVSEPPCLWILFLLLLSQCVHLDDSLLLSLIQSSNSLPLHTSLVMGIKQETISTFYSLLQLFNKVLGLINFEVKGIFSISLRTKKILTVLDIFPRITHILFNGGKIFPSFAIQALFNRTSQNSGNVILHYSTQYLLAIYGS